MLKVDFKNTHVPYCNISIDLLYPTRYGFLRSVHLPKNRLLGNIHYSDGFKTLSFKVILGITELNRNLHRANSIQDVSLKVNTLFKKSVDCFVATKPSSLLLAQTPMRCLTASITA
jgi:hypothetical protein